MNLIKFYFSIRLETTVTCSLFEFFGKPTNCITHLLNTITTGQLFYCSGIRTVSNFLFQWIVDGIVEINEPFISSAITFQYLKNVAVAIQLRNESVVEIALNTEIY